ncbi:DUF4242 domain-containing protein [Sediminicurvatus halobius]|uniref:DUF4242 domain-containing protein n=1 Tax=Sediminicurvatus halobius TaxID=2182432 RepID=A0A2U2N566_9GAMM|nr:DUF4242 domain-containing protein [Spiribacter halobius]PWG64365.1 hypothetical protein DEM34_05660 [Spiribacter halobius]UEX79287.1 DUF4242 domain-containing protein [Spiribacter halobius]
MRELTLARHFDPPLAPGRLGALARSAMPCFKAHRIRWRESWLARDGRRMLCHLQAPDTESLRLALRGIPGEILALWPASVHDAPDPPREPANVVVERRFPAPVSYAEVQAVEDAGAWCLETHRVRFVRTYFAPHRRQMFCLYHAPDAESVRLAQGQAGLPLERVWACRWLRPTDLADGA